MEGIRHMNIQDIDTIASAPAARPLNDGQPARSTVRRVLGCLLPLVLALAPAIAFAHDGLEHVRGTISKVSDQSVTVTTTTGKTVEVLIDTQTTYSRADKPIQKSDLKAGDRVMIHAAEKGSTLTAHTVEVALSRAKKP
jgi:hypothetical protein